MSLSSVAILAVGLVASTLAADPPAPAATFKDQAKASGVEAILKNTYAHAAAWGDANGDGYPDLFWGAFNKQGPNRLLINQRDGTFKESVQQSVNRPEGRASGAVFADLDNDGALDLVCIDNARGGTFGNQLLKNDGKGNFTDVTAGSGLDVRLSGRSAFVLDYDGDGLLDLFVQNDMWGRGNGSILLRNNGKMKFTDVTAKAGLPAGPSELLGLGGASGDFNGDGWPDLLLANTNMKGGAARKAPKTSKTAKGAKGVKSEARATGDAADTSDAGEQWRADVRLYINNRKSGFVQAKNFDFNAAFPWFGNQEDWICGAAIGDLNGDGRLDAVIGVHYGSSMGSKALAVRAFLNKGNDAAGNPNWQDITSASGIQALFIKQPHVEIQDFNNDGKMDLWSGAAMKQTADGQFMPYIQYNQGNNAQGVPQFAPAPGLSPAATAERGPSREAAGNPRYFAASPTADYDLDGRLDIFGADFHVPAENNHSFLFHNTTLNSGNYLAVKIDRGDGVPNRFGIGAVVRVYQAGQAGNPQALLGAQAIEINNGYCSGRPATAHFGTPARDTVDVVVQLPNGGPTLKATGVKTNQVLTVSK